MCVCVCVYLHTCGVCKPSQRARTRGFRRQDPEFLSINTCSLSAPVGERTTKCDPRPRRPFTSSPPHTLSPPASLAAASNFSTSELNQKEGHTENRLHPGLGATEGLGRPSCRGAGGTDPGANSGESCQRGRIYPCWLDRPAHQPSLQPSPVPQVLCTGARKGQLPITCLKEVMMT